MGNLLKSESLEHRQNTWRICMVCNRNKTLNDCLMILKVYKHSNDKKELLLRCSQGHILLYEDNNEHIDFVLRLPHEPMNIHNKELLLINKLQKENSLLKEQIKNCDPSAPPLLAVELVEALEIR